MLASAGPGGSGCARYAAQITVDSTVTVIYNTAVYLRSFMKDGGEKGRRGADGGVPLFHHYHPWFAFCAMNLVSGSKWCGLFMLAGTVVMEEVSGCRQVFNNTLELCNSQFSILYAGIQQLRWRHGLKMIVTQAKRIIKGLGDLPTRCQAGSGANGGTQSLQGRRGTDVILQVPIGTVVWREELPSSVDVDESFENEHEVIDMSNWGTTRPVSPEASSRKCELDMQHNALADDVPRCVAPC